MPKIGMESFYQGYLQNLEAGKQRKTRLPVTAQYREKTPEERNDFDRFCEMIEIVRGAIGPNAAFGDENFQLGYYNFSKHRTWEVGEEEFRVAFGGLWDNLETELGKNQDALDRLKPEEKAAVATVLGVKEKEREQEQEAKEKAEREAREKAEREAQEKKDRELDEELQRFFEEREAREKAEREAREKKDRELDEERQRLFEELTRDQQPPEDQSEYGERWRAEKREQLKKSEERFRKLDQRLHELDKEEAELFGKPRVNDRTEDGPKADLNETVQYDEIEVEDGNRTVLLSEEETRELSEEPEDGPKADLNETVEYDEIEWEDGNRTVYLSEEEMRELSEEPEDGPKADLNETVQYNEIEQEDGNRTVLLKEKAEREAREKAEREAREKAEREAREKAEREAREKAEREAQEKAEREAREKAEREAREKKDRELDEERQRLFEELTRDQQPPEDQSEYGERWRAEKREQLKKSEERFREPDQRLHELDKEEAELFGKPRVNDRTEDGPKADLNETVQYNEIEQEDGNRTVLLSEEETRELSEEQEKNGREKPLDGEISRTLHTALSKAGMTEAELAVRDNSRIMKSRSREFGCFVDSLTSMAAYVGRNGINGPGYRDMIDGTDGLTERCIDYLSKYPKVRATQSGRDSYELVLNTLAAFGGPGDPRIKACIDRVNAKRGAKPETKDFIDLADYGADRMLGRKKTAGEYMKELNRRIAEQLKRSKDKSLAPNDMIKAKYEANRLKVEKLYLKTAVTPSKAVYPDRIAEKAKELWSDKQLMDKLVAHQSEKEQAQIMREHLASETASVPQPKTAQNEKQQDAPVAGA